MFSIKPNNYLTWAFINLHVILVFFYFRNKTKEHTQQQKRWHFIAQFGNDVVLLGKQCVNKDIISTMFLPCPSIQFFVQVRIGAYPRCCRVVFTM